MNRPATNLQDWIGTLRREGEVLDVEAEVDPVLEAPEIHRRVIAAGGPALLFRRPKGADFPLVTNLFGTARRVRLAFGDRPEELIGEIARLPHELVPPSPRRLWEKRGVLRDLARVGLKRRSRAPVTAIVDRPARLGRLPATHSWPRDGGRFLTLPLVYTEDPDTSVSNLGMYRVQLFDEETTGLHMQIGKGGGFHLARAWDSDRALPVNIHLGGPPALILAAIAPLPENVPEVLLASLVQGQRLELAKNPAGPLPVVGQAEFALVGRVEPRAMRPEGPFGDHYGYYSEVHDYPLFRCDALLHRKDAVFPATVVGKPRQEDFYIGDYLQELLSPLISLAMPGVRDLWSYGETGYHSLAAAVVHERYKREAMASAFRILGEGQLSLTKFLLATDAPIDLRDFRTTLVHVLERADFRTDLFLFSNLSMDSLDYAGPRINEGSKGVLLGLGDPVRKLPEAFEGPLPEGIEDVRVYAPGCLVLQGPPHDREPGLAARVAAWSAFGHWPLLVVTDDAGRAARSDFNFLWTTFTRFDPAGDIQAAGTQLLHNHVAFVPPLAIDARMKAGYPEELFADARTRELVESRWSEYFPAGGVEMGDSDQAHLD